MTDPDLICPKFFIQGLNVTYLNDNNYHWDGFTSNFVDEDNCECKTFSFSETSVDGDIIATMQIDDRDFFIQGLSDGRAVISRYDPDSSYEDFCSNGTGDGEQPETQIEDDNFTENSLESRTDDYCPVDVLFVAGNQISTPRALTLLALECINDFNRIASNSRIDSRDLKLRFAGIEIIPFVYTSSSTADLLTLRTDPNVIAERNQTGADIVVLFQDDSYSTTFGQVAMVAATEGFSFLQVDINEAIGKIPVFAHEVGHILSARHGSAATVGSTHAFDFKKCLKTYNTVVMEGGATGSRIPFFSNPTIEYRNKAIGTVARENASATIRGAACTVASFRDPALLPSFVVTIDGLDRDCPDRTVAVETEVLRAPLGQINYEWSTSLDGIRFTPFPSSFGWANVILPSTEGQVLFVRVIATNSIGETSVLYHEILAKCEDGDSGGPLRPSKTNDNQLNKEVLATLINGNISVTVTPSSDIGSAYSLSLVTLDGRMVWKGKVGPSGVKIIEADHLCSGIYFLSAYSNKHLYTSKIIMP